MKFAKLTTLVATVLILGGLPVNAQEAPRRIQHGATRNVVPRQATAARLNAADSDVKTAGLLDLLTGGRYGASRSRRGYSGYGGYGGYGSPSLRSGFPARYNNSRYGSGFGYGNSHRGSNYTRAGYGSRYGSGAGYGGGSCGLHRGGY